MHLIARAISSSYANLRFNPPPESIALLGNCFNNSNIIILANDIRKSLNDIALIEPKNYRNNINTLVVLNCFDFNVAARLIDLIKPDYVIHYIEDVLAWQNPEIRDRLTLFESKIFGLGISYILLYAHDLSAITSAVPSQNSIVKSMPFEFVRYGLFRFKKFSLPKSKDFKIFATETVLNASLQHIGLYFNPSSILVIGRGLYYIKDLVSRRRIRFSVENLGYKKPNSIYYKKYLKYLSDLSIYESSNIAYRSTYLSDRDIVLKQYYLVPKRQDRNTRYILKSIRERGVEVEIF